MENCSSSESESEEEEHDAIEQEDPEHLHLMTAEMLARLDPFRSKYIIIVKRNS